MNDQLDISQHEHTFLTIPGRCSWCGMTDEAIRQIEQHKMLVETNQRLAEAFDRLAAALEKMEAKL